MVADPIDQRKVAEYREETVILSSVRDMLNWEEASSRISGIFELKYVPNIILLTSRAVAELRSKSNQKKILSLIFFSLAVVEIDLVKWTPGFDTLHNNCFLPKARWVSFVGVHIT